MINLAPIAAANKASLDTLFDLSTRAFEGVEQLVALNLQTIKTVLAESKETSLSALQAKSPADLLKLQTEALQAAPQKALSYGHQVQSIFAPIAAAQRATFDTQIADVQAKVLDAVNKAVKDGPAADTILTLAKSTIAAANTAYERANTVSKQVTDAVAANATKVTEAAAKASHDALAAIED